MAKVDFRIAKGDMDGETKLGRPRICPEQDDALENYTARLSFKQARLARKIGGGNFSEGLRAALKHAAEDIAFMEGVADRSKKV